MSSYVSGTYGGSASDRHTIERLTDDIFSHGDSIMAGLEINVQYIFQ